MKIGLTFTLRDGGALKCRSDETPLNWPAMDGSDIGQNDAEEEFDSPETVNAIAEALASLGHEVELLGDGRLLIDRLVAGNLPELVFNIAEGRGVSRSREAWVPAVLELFGIPYTGSDPVTLGATLDKDFAKRLVGSAGVAVPRGVVVSGASLEIANDLVGALTLPVIVKPVFEGSSKGITANSVVDDETQLHDVIEKCHEAYTQPVLVEEYIEGDELTVGIVGNEPEVIGIMRVVPVTKRERFVYGLEVKRDWRRQVRYEVPAKLEQADENAVRKATMMAYRALGCRDVARIDFRLSQGVPYFLEANPLPGLSPGAGDLVLLADGMGIGYRELIGRILNAAMLRYGVDGKEYGDIDHILRPSVGTFS